MTSRLDARNITTTLGYDELNRLTGKSYSDGTPEARWCYDGKTYSGSDCAGSVQAGKRMQLTAVGSSVSATSFDEFDALGRMKQSTQTTGERNYLFQYSYQRDGSLAALTYPSGRQVVYSYDQAGRVEGVGAYATGIKYAAHGALSEMTLGNGLKEVWDHSAARLQARRMRLGTAAEPASVAELEFRYCSTGDWTAECAVNNGNVLSQKISVPGMTALTQYYTYDPLNRLEIVAENPTNPATPACPDAGSQWCQKFEHGVWGNRLMVARSHLGVSPLEPTSFGSNNRMAGAYWDYDGAGNVTRNPLGETFRYDAEDRQTASCTQDPYGCPASVGPGRTLYSYDAEGRRVKKEPPGGVATVYVHDAMGRLAAEYSAEGIANPGVRYLTADHLGSTRVVTGESEQALECRDYHAFGEEILVEAGSPRQGVPCYTADAGVRQKFTGKERDAETGLDDFGIRSYSAGTSRFQSPDPENFGAFSLDPQSWNGYAYSRNNPLKLVDPSGLAYCKAVKDNKDGAELECVTNEEYDKDPERYNGYEYYESNIDDPPLGDAQRVSVGGLAVPIAVAQMDSPAIGPADIIAGAITIGIVIQASRMKDAEASLRTLEDSFRRHLQILDPNSSRYGRDPDKRNFWRKELEKRLKDMKGKLKRLAGKRSEEWMRKVQELEEHLKNAPE